MHSRQRRARRTSREAGVLVEALIAISLLLVMLASAWFTHAVYAQKIAKIYQARNLAWGGTDPGCSHDGEGHPDPVLVTAPRPFGRYALEVSAETRFGCNEQPNDHGDLLSVLEWGLGAGDAVWQELLDVVEAVRHDGDDE
jgi:hypothetical protein